MRVSHVESAVFDDPNLVTGGGLAPVVALARRCDLAALAGRHLSLPSRGGANPHVKLSALVAGMVVGADSIADMDALRHGGMGRLFGGVRAPSTLGTLLRTFTFGHVRQLDAVATRLLARLAAQAPVLPGADVLAFVDVDDTVEATYGYAKQGAGHGYTGVKRADRDGVQPVRGTAERRHPATQGLSEQRPRRRPAGRRRRPNRPRRQRRRFGRHRAGDPAGRQRVLRLPGTGGGPPGRRPLLASPFAPARPSAGRSRASPRTPGSRSTTRTRTGKRKPRLWSATPRSPRSRSPVAARASRSPAGPWSAGSDA